MKNKEFKTIRTSSGLRDALFDELDLLRNGKSDSGRASAVSKLAVQIINSARMEVEFQRFGDIRLNPVEMTSSPIRLGRE